MACTFYDGNVCDKTIGSKKERKRKLRMSQLILKAKRHSCSPLKKINVKKYIQCFSRTFLEIGPEMPMKNKN